MALATGYPGVIRWYRTKPAAQPRRGVDARRAAERFGFKAETPFAEGLQITVDWYLAHRDQALTRDK